MWWFGADTEELDWWKKQIGIHCGVASKTGKPRNKKPSADDGRRLSRAHSLSRKRNRTPEIPFHATPLAAEDTDENTPLFYAAVIHNFEAKRSDELSLVRGQLIAVYEESADSWWYGVESGNEGWFPSNHVHAIKESPGRESAPSSGESDSPAKSCIPATTPYVSLLGPIDSTGPKEPSMDKYSYPTSSTNSHETVYALHSYQAQTPEELSFSKGERLIVLQKPGDDPNWWMAKNVMGQNGLVPRNFIRAEAPESSSGSDDHTKQTWYYGHISRAYAEVILNAFGSVGDFLVRVSESSSGDLALSVRAPGQNHHFKIQVHEDTFRIGFRKFYSVMDLVSYFRRCPIYTSPHGYKLYLRNAARKPGA